MLTFIDSSTTDHCFVDRTIFTTYVPFEKPLASLLAGSSFDIVGKGSISFSTTIDGITRIIDIDNVLYILSFQSNLISMSKLIAKGADVNFNKNGAAIKLQTGEQVMSATKIGELFVLDIDRKTSAFVIQSKKKSVTFNIWHHQLAHTRADKLKEMIMHRLVDGLNVHRDLKLNGQCKDCIFGKHTMHPYTDKGDREKEVLKRIHINIWGPVQTQSAGGSLYFMMIVDGFSFYKSAAFLSTKSANTTLKVLKAYQIEAKCQTGHKLE